MQKKDKTAKRASWVLWLIIAILLLFVVSVGVKYFVYPQYLNYKNKASTSETVSTKIPKEAEAVELPVYNNPEKEMLPNETEISQIRISYYVIGGTFRSVENAEKSFAKYVALGYQPVIIEEEGYVYKVAIGKYYSKTEAEKVRYKFNSTIPHSDVWIYEITEGN